MITPYHSSHLPAVLEVTERAWRPVFPLMQEDIPAYVYDAFYPEGWLKRQLNDVEALCSDQETEVWVYQSGDVISGYLGLRIHPEDSMGEVYIIAVDPKLQKTGIGKSLLEFAFDWMRKRDLKMAFVETGADRGHTPARIAYEKAGFDRYPVARYFKQL